MCVCVYRVDVYYSTLKKKKKKKKRRRNKQQYKAEEMENEKTGVEWIGGESNVCVCVY